MQVVLKSAQKTQIMFSQIILENPSGRYHVKDQQTCLSLRLIKSVSTSDFLTDLFFFGPIPEEIFGLSFFKKITKYIKYKNHTWHNRYKLTISCFSGDYAHCVGRQTKQPGLFEPFFFFFQEHRLKFAKLILTGSESAIYGACVCISSR